MYAIYIIAHPLNDLEMYVQEIGRGGRDGGSTVAVFYYAKRLKRHVDKMIATLCRRDFLFKYVNVGCRCCDVCALVCKCDT